MYFISGKRNGKFGIVDTKDWVEEFYTKEEVEDFKCSGLVIEDVSVQKEVINFMWYYHSTASDCGSSTMDIVDSYLVGSCGLDALYGDVGSSTLDIIESLKSLYISLKSKWTDFDVTTLGRTCKLYDRVASLCRAEYEVYSPHVSQEAILSGMKENVWHIARVYHFQIQNILEGLNTWRLKIEDFK